MNLEEIDGIQTSNYVEVLVQCERTKIPDKCCLRAFSSLLSSGCCYSFMEYFEGLELPPNNPSTNTKC